MEKLQKDEFAKYGWRGLGQNFDQKGYERRQENVGKSVYAFFEQGKRSLAGHSEIWEGLLYIFSIEKCLW